MFLRICRLMFVALFLISFSGPVFAKVPNILKVQDIKPGTKAIGFSVFKGIEPEPFDVELGEPTKQLYLNLVLARLSGGPMDTLLEKIGPVAGMSGSPIFVDCAKDPEATSGQKLTDCIENGTLVGALSYGLAYFIEGGMNFMFTPAEYMLGVNSGGYAAAFQLNHMSPKVTFEGKEFYNLMLFPKIDRLSEGLSPTQKCPDSSGHNLKPGSMISIYIAKGQIPIAASGTVTWVDDNLIYVFGHPFFGIGMVRLPFSHVSVAATIQTPLEPHKIAGCYLDTEGLMIVDGAYEMAGTIGGTTFLLPFQVDINVNGQGVSLYEEIPPSPMAETIITLLPSLWTKSILGDINGLPVAYQMRLAIKDEPEIFVKNIIPALGNPFDGVMDRLGKVMFKDLKDRSLVSRLQKVQVQVNFVSNLKTWNGKTSFLSQERASPGETVYVNVVLEESASGAIKQISIPVKIPNDFLDRLEPGVSNTITVLVQSFSKLSDKRENYFKTPVSNENFIKELNDSLNRQANVLYVQQIMPATKSSRENNLDRAKTATKLPWKWNDLEPEELNQLPAKEDLEVVLSKTSVLEHYIDFDATFQIFVIKPKEEIPKSNGKDQNKKNRKWFLLFLH